MKGLIEIIEEYQIKIPLENLLNIAALIQPRLYTIASSSNRHPKTIHLCIAMQIDSLDDGRTKLGLASTYFMRLHDLFKAGMKTNLKLAVRESTFILPSKNNTPVYWKNHLTCRLS
jgi:sulfite reductase alpha subunit-like flavoprotein